MAIKITTACINCGECERECPNTAIYAPKVPWSFAQGTKLSGDLDFGEDGKLPADHKFDPLDPKYFYIVPDKCTECKGFHEEPQCAAVCPVNCCVPDPDFVESEEELLNKQKWLHNVDADASAATEQNPA